MIPYETGVILSIASPGIDIVEESRSIFGNIMRSRSGAKLKYTINDIKSISKKLPSYGGYIDGEIKEYELINPSKRELIETIESLIIFLNSTPSSNGRKKVLNIIYAGHGRAEDGGLVLKDGVISGEVLYREICKDYKVTNNLLHLYLLIDSCYSSRFLIDILVTSQNNNHVYLYDSEVSSLTDEKSWEMPFLEHGAFSFHLINEGNSHVDSEKLAKAIDEKNQAYIVKSIQGLTIPNPVTFLTNGKQHSVTLTSGGLLGVKGAGSVDLTDHFGSLTHEAISAALNIAKTSYGKSVEYSG